jgi:beta-galactosidase GanA
MAMAMAKQRPQFVGLYFDTDIDARMKANREIATELLGVDWNYREQSHASFTKKYPNSARELLPHIREDILPFKVTFGKAELVDTEIYVRDRTSHERAFAELIK